MRGGGRKLRRPRFGARGNSGAEAALWGIAEDASVIAAEVRGALVADGVGGAGGGLVFGEHRRRASYSRRRLRYCRGLISVTFLKCRWKDAGDIPANFESPPISTGSL